MSIILDTPEYQIVRTASAAGYTDEVIPKPGTAAAVRASLESKAIAALDANTAFLAIASPSNAQTLAQVRLLTRECNALIRVLLSRLDRDDA